MSNTIIKLKRSGTSESSPSSLEFGELALNYADGKLFYKAANNTILQFESGGGGEDSFGTVNANGTLVVADTPGDILTLESSGGISIVGDAINDKITISGEIIFDRANLAFDRANTIITTSSTAPSSPDEGNLWWDTDAGTLFIYYNDGDSSQWVEAVPQYIQLLGNTHILTGNLTVTEDLFVQGTLFETSDISLKDDVVTITKALELVSNLRGVNFKWKKDKNQSTGVIAQEVEEVLPHIVATDDNGIKSVNYTSIIGILIEAIKELSSQVEDIKKCQR
jgi:hypothetical protein